MSRITSSTTGTITRRSRALAFCVSSDSALAPPTRASGDTPCTAARTSEMVRTAGCESADAVVTTSMRTRPSTTRGGVAVAPGGPSGTPVYTDTESTPATSRAACTTAPASASGVRTIAGWTAPAGKCSASSCCPETASTLVRKTSVWLVPLAWSVGRNAAPPARASAVTTQTRRGCRPTNPASRPQPPVRISAVASVPGAAACAPTSTGRGTRGQNSARDRLPKISRKAGRSVITARRAAAMPSDPTGPRLLFEARSDRVRQSRPAITVPALAAIGAIDIRRARRMATNGLATCRSSSR